MATTVGHVWSTLLPGKTAAVSKSFSSSSALRLAPANVRSVRFVTSAAASKPVETTEKQSKPRGIMKPKPISATLQELLGVSEIPRTEALKQIWAYIKEHNLQDPENKKIIVCDEKLKKIFAGKERVNFLEISGLLNPHFIK